MKTKRISFLVVILIVELTFLAGYITAYIINKPKDSVIFVKNKDVEKPLEKYSIESLSKTDIPAGTLEISDILSEQEKYISYLFLFHFVPGLDNKIIKTTTGVINIPKTGIQNGSYPVILMIRGFVNQKIYVSGMGTKNAANYFAENGFITIAPDFLGYAKSDREAENIFESRFQTYVTVLSLLKSIEEMKNNRDQFFVNKVIIDEHLTAKLLNYSTINIWGHSNGGQIALTILEITGKNFPTVLWAPVSKPFPYSVLYYTDESEDRGKFIRTELSKFEALYDVEKYSLTNYYDKISAPIQLHQGTSDDAVPANWSDTLNDTLKTLNKNVVYIKHSGADHNMNPAWNEAIEQNIGFYTNSTVY
ncbi:MAG: hypothetical protein US95_C0001G0024 [Candidatus Woesebacteria bacterium GW2011_GWB1_38_5]|uniref:Peptidase S9 prolyl oligopeptidase catalytic domain-containing protein n=4 Tax=Candidatus Woeseibacteriota TaxID=1752722 RepID=A0A0G0K7I7_9BACT|nr:MAG: hypothetical protein US67_C0003G0012 [Candidatus Woesebacteria bacterium GW2011_GWD1_38_10]KKQ56953.1 MAG: hypothetical protein US75_C0001G0010 [Candidatus Woesebacteria bacterium GW2011_GWC1_38_13]KKQ75593.1 MAG: hypothetical protein US95_C0001G0024 [Candidatus Woesebacteria bacterium GW2011_GWB1_38_5]KKQ84539.1 MAG: hypothetical protein UT06_C0003G0012 [Candidatus Woesebacteria bacterium GW2011_GWA1_38_8]